MGAWSHGSFENDDALDWIWQLEESEGYSALDRAFGAVIQSEDYLEAPDCSAAVAAAEVLAAMQGKPASSLPDGVKGWLPGKPKPSAELVQRAAMALDRIMEASELRDMWTEGGESNRWWDAMKDLRARLE